jgi:hypothetical protein
LIRAGLVRLALAEHVLLLTVHHIVSDGWSQGVLVREVGALYKAFSERRESPLEDLKESRSGKSWRRRTLSC